MRKLIIADLDGTIYKKQAPFFQQVRKNLEKAISSSFKKMAPLADCSYSYSKLPSVFPGIMDLCAVAGIPISAFKGAYEGIDFGAVQNDTRLCEMLQISNADVWVITYAPENYTKEILVKLGIYSKIKGHYCLEDFERNIGYPYRKIEVYDALIRKNSFSTKEVFVLGDTWEADLRDAYLKDYNTILITDLTLRLFKAPSGVIWAKDIYQGLSYIIRMDSDP